MARAVRLFQPGLDCKTAEAAEFDEVVADEGHAKTTGMGGNPTIVSADRTARFFRLALRLA